jgi:hypothetical protein
LQNLIFKFLQGCLELLPKVFNCHAEIASLIFGSELLLSCDSQLVDGVFIEFGPVLVDDFLGGVVELDAFLGVGVEVGGGQAALLVLEAVRVEADQIYFQLFGLHG